MAELCPQKTPKSANLQIGFFVKMIWHVSLPYDSPHIFLANAAFLKINNVFSKALLYSMCVW